MEHVAKNMAHLEPLTDLTLGEEKYLAEMRARINKLRTLAKRNHEQPSAATKQSHKA